MQVYNQSNDSSEINFDPYLRVRIKSLQKTLNKSKKNIAIKVKTPVAPVILEHAVGFPLGRIIIELVLNAIKHAFPHPKKRGIIEIKVTQKDAILTLQVEDDGIGYPEDFDTKSTQSFGIKLINKLAIRELKADQSEYYKTKTGGAGFLLQINLKKNGTTSRLNR